MAGNNDIAAAQGNNDRPRIRIKLLPRGSRSSSASSSKSPTDAQKALETASVLAAMKNNQTIPEESSLTVSPVSANNSSSSPEEKPSKNPSPNNSSDKKKKKKIVIAKNKSNKRRNSDETRRTTKTTAAMSENWPPCPITNPDPSGIALWREGCEAVQRPDGSVDGLDVVNWMMTRRGGVANPWPRLEENQAAVRAMGRQRIDPRKILQQQEEEAEIARLKEERRQANKRRYRPRGQIAKEKAERAAAAAAAAEQAKEKAQEEISGTNKRPLDDETEADKDEPQAKKTKLDAVV
ncbi:hypothetical protein N0V84_001313 [Fusarium piperis]|uniref:Uncharacterized protein n=1 Tax=Fusarium piperis TaxID=1435070 RepID=A0A9W8WLA3_9HYPO|nr:hypothetical protein N0V84_001313 [Fusarium piperis]